MRMIHGTTVLAIGIACTATATAGAQQAAPMHDPATDPGYCDRVRVAVPPELTGWSMTTPLSAGGSVARAPVIVIGRGIAATLRPAARIAWAVRPGKEGAKGGQGGLFTFNVVRAGRYRVALGDGAWIDVVRAHRSLTSVAHAHGPQCTGIRKMVDFELKPGRHQLQISGAKTADLTLMVAKLAR